MLEEIGNIIVKARAFDTVSGEPFGKLFAKISDNEAFAISDPDQF